MRVSVIVSTYNHPAWLEKVLWGFSRQTHTDFEIVIADDGSNDTTRALIDKIGLETGLHLIHVWHEDSGFRKSEILNKAIVKSSTQYLIFTDGDCIPRSDFVSVHAQRARPGYFLSGGYFKLPMDVSARITRDDIVAGRHVDTAWLRSNGVRGLIKMSKLAARGPVAAALNLLTPTKATWNGHNSSGWKQGIVRVNGFDERMQYGGQDRELGERLVNAGIRTLQIRYSAVCVHLDHKRGYKTDESISKNRAIRKETVGKRMTWTEYGIEKGPAPALVRT